MRCKNKNSFACFIGRKAKLHKTTNALAVGLFALVFGFGVYQGIRLTFAVSTNADKSAALDSKGEHFEIMYFWGPSAEQINANASTVVSNIADAGFTIAPMRAKWSAPYSYDGLSTAINSLNSKNLKTMIFNAHFAESDQAVNPTVKNYIEQNMNASGYSCKREQ